MTDLNDDVTSRTLSIPRADDAKKPPIATAVFTPTTPTPDQEDAAALLIFSHGAGGDMSTDAIANFRDGFAPSRAIATFNGNMNLKSRVGMFKAVANALGDEGHGVQVFGGRSMGARAAIAAAAESAPDRVGRVLVLVSYPLHTDKEVRDQLLLDLDESWRVLFISGDHDSMCELSRLEDVRGKMRARSWLVVVEGANHGMTVKPNAGTREVGMMTGRVAAEWVGACDDEKVECTIAWNGEGKKAVWSGWLLGREDHDEHPAPSGGQQKQKDRAQRQRTEPEDHPVLDAKPKKATKKRAPSQKRKSSPDTQSRTTRSSARLRKQAKA